MRLRAEEPLLGYGAWALALVAALALQNGYIHPDEWHQSVEVAASAVTGVRSGWPWEFREAAARSVLVPALSAGPPLLILSALRCLSAGALVAAMRAYLSLTAGVLCRCAAVRASEAMGADAACSRRAGAALAGSWPALVLLCRPLSNTLEAASVAVTLLLALPAKSPGPPPLAMWRFLSLGGVLGVATFCRFTAPLFLGPLLALALARAQAQSLFGVRLASCAAALVLGAAAAAACCLAADTAFYGRTVVTPLNSLRYNSRAANLALHGTHPRLLHAAVNLPLLAMPLMPHAMASVVAAARALLSARRGRDGAPLSSLLLRGEATACALALACALPMACLSLAPHQEARFLLPMLLPLAALGGGEALRTRRRRALWLLFNVPLALFFGGAHQGGVVPAAAAVGGHLGLRTPAQVLCGATVTWWRSYMPPRSLMMLHAHALSTRVVDVGDAPMQELLAVLERDDATPGAHCGCSTRYLVMPGWAHPPDGWEPLAPPFAPHFSGEDVGQALQAWRGGLDARHAWGLAAYTRRCAVREVG